MAKVVKYPKRPTIQMGVSPNSIFIKGPQAWIDKVLAAAEKDFDKSLTVVVSNPNFLAEWDMTNAINAEVVLLNLPGPLADDNTHLFPIKFLARFEPQLFIYVDDKISKFAQHYLETCSIKPVKSEEDLYKNAKLAMNDLLVKTKEK